MVDILNKHKIEAVKFLNDIIKQVEEAVWLGDVRLHTEMCSRETEYLTFTLQLKPAPKLKPCPMCGGTAEVKKVDELYGLKFSYSVGCEDCTAATYGDTKEEAITVWNRRSENGKNRM